MNFKYDFDFLSLKKSQILIAVWIYFLLGVLNLEDVFGSRVHSILQVGEALLDTIKTAWNDFIRVRRKPPLLQSSREESEENVSEFLAPSLDANLPLRAVWSYIRMNASNHRLALLDIFRDCRIVLSRKDKRDFAALFRQHLADVLETVMLTNGIESIVDLARSSLLQRVLNTRHYCIISAPVVDNGIAFAPVNESLNEALASSRNCNNWVNV